jgi:hypothetical protein
MDESKNQWHHQKVLLKSFPMNGHVSRFRNSFYFLGISPFELSGDGGQNLKQQQRAEIPTFADFEEIFLGEIVLKINECIVIHV